MLDKILDGKVLANKLNLALQLEIKNTIDKTNVIPKLVTILVGKDPGSQIYIKIKQRTCEQVGIESELLQLDEKISKEKLKEKINELNLNDTVHGILLQLPLPNSLRAFTPEILEKISPEKDVDGLSLLNKGKLFDYDEELAPCTPKGIIKLLEHYNINLKGKEVVIINRSNLVGKPLIFMLLKRNATVSICHTSTLNLEDHMRRADILVVAVGRPNFVTKEKIKEGVIIIDVGTNRVDGKLCGDADLNDVLDKCTAISPSPGGIGPLTVSFLLQNVFTAYKNILNLL